MILACELKTDITSPSIGQVAERLVEFTGMKNVSVEDRTRLGGDNGSSYLSHAFEDYLAMLRIRHIPARRITSELVEREIFREEGRVSGS